MPKTGFTDTRARYFDLRLLHAFVAVTNAGNISRAAQRLCRSQSAVSEQIKKLEAACGVPLFKRARRGVAPTAAGERLLPHAREMLALSDAAYRDMHDARLTGELHLGITDYFRPAAIATLLRRIQSMHPALRLHISIRDSATIEADADQFDIGLSMTILEADARGDAASSGQAGIALRREALVWAGPAAFDTRPPAPLPLVALHQPCALRQSITRRLSAADIGYEVTHSASGVAGLQAAVLAGLGITCINQSALLDDMVDLGDALALPRMPDVEFRLTPARPGETQRVADVRHMLASVLQ